ncbi:MAG: peptidoglycan bridge formation glycyltransferase FemA/FemB family protein [Candidatus Pacebacteria bacterium]|nr:peptidoglycan bridge formation glycyltransferase FemA/FemB family protein [Candidatus Paceibacterota bacterium]
MEIKKNKEEKENWNSFLLQNNASPEGEQAPYGASFLQSFEWGEFQEKLGRKTWRLVVDPSAGASTELSRMSSGQAGEILLQALVVKKPLPLGKSFLYIPFGPCFKQGLSSEQEKQALELLLKEINEVSVSEKVVYCYVEPFRDKSGEPSPHQNWAQVFGGLGSLNLQKPQKRIQPQQTLVIDLTPEEEKIFRSLKSKTTRYNVRFGQKAGLQFESPDVIGDKEIEIFYNLAQKSAQRDGFTNYDKDYFDKLFSISSEDLQIKLFFAKHKDHYIAANIFVFFGKTAVHLFGGFDHDFRSLMAPYFMHWNQMLFAKNKMNCAIYDFWGIDEKKWPGVTHFKRSFGGREIEYPVGIDVVYNKFWYKIFGVARKVLRK